MVAEARAYREKVLSELSRRRELAREQIEHLIHHRDRLATAFERARLAATDVVGDLDEFDELADEIEKGAGLMAGTGTPVFVDHTADPEAIPQRTIAAVDDGESTNETPEVEVVDVIETEVVVEEQIQEAAQSPVEVANESRQTAVMAEHPSTEQPRDYMAEVVQLFAPKKAEPSVKSAEKAEELAPAVVEESSSEKSQVPRSKEKKSVDELFAKLREAKVEEVARTLSEPSTKPEPEVESTPIAPKARKIVVPPTNPAFFEQRDSVLAPLNTTMNRAIKRVLADFENGSLTLLQSKKFVVSIDTLMPPADSMAQELVEAIADDMMNSALAGAQSVARGLKADLRKRVTKTLVLQVISPQVAELIVNPLRSQIQRSIEQCDADKNEMSGLTRSAFRELKIQRVDAIVADLSCLAYSRGAYLAHTPGAMVCWMVDPNGPSCADAEDNSLAGPCPIGETFPTGHLHPICHAGCRCLLGPAT
jgi:hypothetical protein